MARRLIRTIPVTIPVSSTSTAYAFSFTTDSDSKGVVGVVIPYPDNTAHANWPFPNLSFSIECDGLTHIERTSWHLVRDNGNKSQPFFPLDIPAGERKIIITFESGVTTAVFNFDIVFKQL